MARQHQSQQLVFSMKTGTVQLLLPEVRKWVPEKRGAIPSTKVPIAGVNWWITARPQLSSGKRFLAVELHAAPVVREFMWYAEAFAEFRLIAQDYSTEHKVIKKRLVFSHRGGTLVVDDLIAWEALVKTQLPNRWLRDEAAKLEVVIRTRSTIGNMFADVPLS